MKEEKKYLIPKSWLDRLSYLAEGWKKAETAEEEDLMASHLMGFIESVDILINKQNE